MYHAVDRVDAGRSYRGGHGHANMTSTAINATAPLVDESKLSLKFCVRGACTPGGGGVVLVTHCVCCQTLPGIPCFPSYEECDDACPVCDPDCPTIYPPPPPPPELLA